MNQSGNLTSEEKIAFYGSPDLWLVFSIEMTVILIQKGILDLFTPESSGVGGNTHPHLYFQSAWLGMVLNMEVNNLLLRWPMHEG